MSLIRWKPKEQDPFKDFLNMDHPFFGLSLFPVLDQSFKSFREVWNPAVDVSENEDHYFIKADLPGLKKGNIKLSVEGNLLTIKGERKYENEIKVKDTHRVERAYGAFVRRLDLEQNIDQSKVKAKYKDGVLEITVPKTEESKASQIEVEED